VCGLQQKSALYKLNARTFFTFENRDVTGSRTRDYSEDQAVLDFLETRVECEEGQSRVSYSSQV
jgi:hypothetical protein